MVNKKFNGTDTISVKKNGDLLSTWVVAFSNRQHFNLPVKVAEIVFSSRILDTK